MELSAARDAARPSREYRAAPRVHASLRSLILVRVALYLGAAAVPLFLVDIDGSELAVWVCVGAAALQPLLIPVSRRVHYQLAQAVFDAIVVVAIAFAVPELWYTSLILLVAGSTLLAATARPELHLLILGLLVEAMLVLGAVAGPVAWAANVLIAGTVLIVALRGSAASRRQQQRTEDHLGQAMEAARAIMVTIDLERLEVVEATGDVEEVTGWAPETWLTVDKVELLHPDDLAGAREAVQRLEHVPELDLITRSYDAEGKLRWLRCTGRVEVDQRGRRVLRGMLADVTAIHRISDELYEQARRDRVTGLPNRQRLEEELDLRAVQAEPFALLIADIRQFKAINDTLGHHIGDLVLSMMGNRLAEQSDAARMVFRLSADQFAVVLDGVTEAEQAVAVSRQIAQDCRRPYYVGRVALGAPVAVGVALSAPNVAPSVTLRQADVALHAAKTRNSQVEVFHADMQRFTLENLMLSAAVEHGLDHGEFVLHFQPQVDLRTGRVVGAEGLVRWHHPDRGVLPPSEFLETLRVSASFDRFTLAMVRQAAQAAASAQGAAHSIGFAVNIEMSSLLSPGFTDRMLAELAGHQIGQHRVVLEVTETALADTLLAGSAIDPLAELARLRAAGYEIAIDDFGTGASTLARLDRLPADEVKIDRSFVQAIASSERSELLLGSIIQLGNNLGLRVVAEGIEQLNELAYLTKANCAIGQGWLFSKAVTLPELLATINHRYPIAHSRGRNAESSVTPLWGRRSGPHGGLA